MKRTIIALIVIVFLGISCKKVTPVPEILTFSVNGVSRNFSKNITVEEYAGSVTIYGETSTSGTSSTTEFVQITLPKIGTGNYNELTYNLMGGGAIKPNIEYADGWGNFWSYYGGDISPTYCYFNIDVKKYSSTGEVSGTFEGTLDFDFDNGSLTPDSMVIRGGIFSHRMTSTME